MWQRPASCIEQYPKDQLVIGLAGSYREACLLAGEIVLDVLKKTGSTDIRGIFKRFRREYLIEFDWKKQLKRSIG